jgi:hypothetical protein
MAAHDRKAIPRTKSVHLSVDPTNQFCEAGLLPYFDELGCLFLNESLHALNPIDRMPDFLSEKILNVLFS